METTSNVLLELEAMKEIAQALEKIEAERRESILAWAASRYCNQPHLNGRVNGAVAYPESERTTTARTDQEFTNLGDLFAAVAPETQAEKALVVAFWLDKFLGQSEFETYNISSELKHLGHELSNVSKTIDDLLKLKPQPIIQTKKSGNTQQARKKFKVTAEGRRQIELKLQSRSANRLM